MVGTSRRICRWPIVQRYDGADISNALSYNLLLRMPRVRPASVRFMSWNMRCFFVRMRLSDMPTSTLPILERLENEIQARERKYPLSKARRIVERYRAGRS